LKYRTFPPFLIRTLADEGYLNQNELEPIPIVEMERVEIEFVLR
jgi:hypothetical protein